MISFETKKQMENYLTRIGLSKLSNGNFYNDHLNILNHGEFSSPEYKPTRYKDGWGVKVLYFYHTGALNAPIDRRLKDIWQDNGYISADND